MSIAPGTSDAYDTSTDHGLNNCKRGGNRLVTTLLYLSDVDAVRGPSSAVNSQLLLPA